MRLFRAPKELSARGRYVDEESVCRKGEDRGKEGRKEGGNGGKKNAESKGGRNVRRLEGWTEEESQEGREAGRIKDREKEEKEGRDGRKKE